MKKLAILLISSIVLFNNTAISQKTAVNDPSKGFDCELFNRALIDEMQSQFPTMRLDTTNNYLLRIRSQKESGHSPIYALKNGGMARLDENEKIQAKRLVKEYKEKLSKMGFDEKSIVNCNFTEFAALAIKENGLVRYGLIVDNNFKYEDLGVEIIYEEE
jgi:hypothetical protein